MAVMLNRPSAAMLACILAIVVPSLLVAQPIPVERQIQIQDVRLGFPAGSMDMYKEGKWVPVVVNIGPPKELNNLPADFQGSIEVITKDSDGWNTHLLKDNVVVTKENSRGIFQSYIKVSDSTSFNGVQVRLRGKLGSTEINTLYSYPSPDKMRVGSRTSVDHDNVLVVNIGNSHGLRATPEENEATTSTGRAAQKLMTIVSASPNKLFELPDRWYGYESVDAVVIATGQNFGNSLAQQLARDTVRREALEQWILQGGHLVVTVAGNAGVVGSPTDFPLEPLLPMKINRGGAEKAERLSGLTDFIQQTIPQNLRRSKSEIRGIVAPYARLEPKPDVKVMMASLALDNASFKRPLIVRSAYGLGKITLVGFDTNTEVFQSWDFKQDFWSAVLEARAITPAMNAYYGAPREDASLALANRIEEFGDVPVISFALVALFIALYIILIGPVDYFVLKKVFKRLEYTWITFPTVVLLVSLAAYFGAYYLKGDKLRINKVDLIDVDMKRERVMGSSWLAIFSPRLQNYQIDIEPQGVTGATPTLSWLGRFSSYGGARMVGQSSGGLFERDYDYTPTATGLRQLPIQVWSQKSLEARWLGSLDRSRTPIENKLSKKEGLGIKGTVKSKLPVKLKGVKLYYGEKVWNIGDLDPDKEFQLDVATQGAAGVMGGVYYERKLDRNGTNSQQPDFANDINGLIFSGRTAEGAVKSSEFLRYLNQSWRLKDYSEAILIGVLADDYGDAAKLNQGGTLGTRLKLTNAAGNDLLTGTMRHASYLRVFLPVAEEGK